MLTLAVLGVAVHLLLPQLAELERSAQVLREMRWWALALAVAAQVASYGGSGYLRDRIVLLFQMRLSPLWGAMVTLASSSLGLIWGGSVTTAGATFRWVRARGVPAEGALLAGWLPPLVNLFTTGVVAVFGLLYLLVAHRLSAALVVGFVTATGLLGGVCGAVAWGVRHRAAFTRVVQRAGRVSARVRRRAYDPASGEAAAGRVFGAWDVLRGGGWRGVLLGDALNVGFDVLTLYFVFVAAGHAVSPGVLLAGYGLPLLLAKVTVLPGGVGVVEGSMAALYEALGVPSAVTVIVVLGYRLLSFWLPMLLGFPLVALLDREDRGRTGPPRSAVEP